MTSETTDIPEEAPYLFHYGTLRESGRYPYGSGANPAQRNRQFLDDVARLKKEGQSEKDIATGMGISMAQLRINKSIAKNQQKQAQIDEARKLSDKNWSNVAIGQKMGLPESSVRVLLNPSTKEKNDQLVATANMLKDQIAKKEYLDIGSGTEHHIGVSATALNNAVGMLREEGYRVDKLQVEQMGTGKFTTIKVLSGPDKEFRDVARNQNNIKTITDFSEDHGRSFLGLATPLNVDSKRVMVRYGDEGGADMDGVIQVRRGVDDISLGKSKYAQVRIAVDGTHYLKGMAIYNDNMPPGVDLIFNSNKKSTGNKLDAMKEMKADDDNPFGAIVRQQLKKGPDGKEYATSAMNIVNEEGDWDKWSKNISSQVLSKQSPVLAKEQLALKYQLKKAEYDEIMALTNPAIKKKLLESLSDGLDSSAVHLKAAALPRQRTQVILPINSLKDTEVYAPNFKNGEKVVLVRYPHGGTFEIPELTVNNRNREATSILKDKKGSARDAVGINATVAKRLSGADFDGDTVLVIPNNDRRIKNSKPLESLKDFDAQRDYPKYEGMKVMSARTKQIEMGKVSNLITDMTIAGASHDHIARAVRHSMVVIDAEKHKLNYLKSAEDNGIADLKRKYQGGANKGASTLISRASSEARVGLRKPRPAKDGGPIDAATGKKMWVSTGDTNTIPRHVFDAKTGKKIYLKDDDPIPPGVRLKKNGQPQVVKAKTSPKVFKSTRMAEVDDAFDLVSDNATPIEVVYAGHANRIKALANQSRKDYLATKPIPYSPSAKKAYAPEVTVLRAKLNDAQRNSPLERQAQLYANTIWKQKLAANPDMDTAEKKKVKSLALDEGRRRFNAKKESIQITPKEWEAIQSGAISNNMLEDILSNMKSEDIKKLATPRESVGLAPARASRAKAMLAAGATQAEVAEQLGVSVSVIDRAVNPPKEG